ncbi:MAG: hypothetical protein JWO12_2816 [Frankiales bacterium]|nr:hypothetical protein [Frankiales bacterium]
MVCDECGFDPALYTASDLEGTLTMAPHVARQVVAGATPEVVERLAPVLSPLASLTEESDVHEVMHRLHQAGRVRASAVPTQRGRVEQVSSSAGGVPKLPIDHADLDAHGITVDAQADRRNHGRPWQAVCLWSVDAIEGLQAEGHPIGFGSAGENLTVSGLDWTSVTPGVRLQVGSALLQVTSYAIPCSKNARWFSDGGFWRLSHERRPGRSRVYALVLSAGSVSPGDAVVLEP